MGNCTYDGCTKRAILNGVCAGHLAAPPVDEIDKMVADASQKSAAEIMEEAVRLGYIAPTSEYASLRRSNGTTTTP